MAADAPALRTIDLFSGAGGMSLGFGMARPPGSGVAPGTAVFAPVLAVDSDRDAAETFGANFGCEVWCGPIEELDLGSLPEADAVIGGPPCQGFSRLARGTPAARRAQTNALWERFAEVVEAVRPACFAVENVPEFLRSDEFASFERLMAAGGPLSEYEHAFGVLDAVAYGAAQRRRRGFVLAARGRRPPFPPPSTHAGGGIVVAPAVTVRDAIGDLPSQPTRFSPGPAPVGADGRQDLHFARRPTARSLARFEAVPEGGNRFNLQRNRPDLLPDCWANHPTGASDSLGRLRWDFPAATIRCEFYKPEKGRYLHPSEHRAITHREAARLQGFPDEFVFCGPMSSVARQIGNAVPPPLASAVARCLLAALDG